MYNFIYLLLKERLQAISDIKLIEWELEQDTPNNKGALVVLPGVIIDFDDAEAQSLGEGVQEIESQFTLRLITDCLYDDDKRIHDTTATTHLDIFNKIHQAISGFNGKLSDIAQYSGIPSIDDYHILNTVDRISFSLPKRNGDLMRSRQTFQYYAKDYTGSKQFQKVIKGFEVLQTEMTL